MTQPYQAVLKETATQILDHVDRLAPTHSLPAQDPDGPPWWEMENAISGAYLVQAKARGVREGKAIIMAGAPGAGKSRGVATAKQALGRDQARSLGLDEEGFITIDADDVKQLLLGNPVSHLPIDASLLDQARQHWDSLIQDEAPHPLPDGIPLLRGELAVLVHHLSNTIAEEARRKLLDLKYNVKIEGTLQWEGQGPKLAAELESAEYSQVTICVVDTPEAQCQEGAFQRWAQPRAMQDPTARYTPPGVVSDPFGPDGNRCHTNAENTQTTLQSLNIPAHLITIDRANSTVHHIEPDGTSHTYPIPVATVSPTVTASRPPTRTTPNKTSTPSTTPNRTPTPRTSQQTTTPER